MYMQRERNSEGFNQIYSTLFKTTLKRAVLCALAILSFPMGVCDTFTHIHQGRWTRTGATVWVAYCQLRHPLYWYNQVVPDNNKAGTRCIFQALFATLDEEYLRLVPAILENDPGTFHFAKLISCNPFGKYTCILKYVFVCKLWHVIMISKACMKTLSTRCNTYTPHYKEHVHI